MGFHIKVIYSSYWSNARLSKKIILWNSSNTLVFMESVDELNVQINIVLFHIQWLQAFQREFTGFIMSIDEEI